MEDYDLDTPEGMEDAKRWTLALLSTFNEGGAWLVPRTMSIYRVYPSTQTLVKVTGLPEPSITRVMLALGWKIREDPPF